MLKNLENHPTLDQAIKKWGHESQVDICEEECAELIVALKQFKRGRIGINEVAEEVADVIITALQVRKMISETFVDRIIAEKMERLKCRIEQ